VENRLTPFPSYSSSLTQQPPLQREALRKQGVARGKGAATGGGRGMVTVVESKRI